MQSVGPNAAQMFVNILYLDFLRKEEWGFLDCFMLPSLWDESQFILKILTFQLSLIMYMDYKEQSCNDFKSPGGTPFFES